MGNVIAPVKQTRTALAKLMGTVPARPILIALAPLFTKVIDHQNESYFRKHPTVV
jgi:hypothetical protein